MYSIDKKSIYKFKYSSIPMEEIKEMDNSIFEQGYVDLGQNPEDVAEDIEKIGQNQFYDIVTSKKPDWQAIIYDLIHTEQLDPWDIDLIRLTEKYFEKILQIEDELEGEESPDFYASSKVLLAASLLLRIKSEFLLNKHIKSIDEVLFGKKEDKKYIMERIEIDEDELPILIPKTPLPRARRVTLQELMGALNKAMSTESRRIKREVSIKRAQKLSEVDFPEFKRIDVKDRIKHFYARVLSNLKRKVEVGSSKNAEGHTEKHLNKVSYGDLIGKEREEKLASFLPLLHLSNSKKLWLEQENHLEEIWIYLHTYFNKNKEKFLEELEEDIEEMKEEMAGSGHGGVEIKGREIDIKVSEDAKWITKLFGGLISNLNKEEDIEKITGFDESDI